MKYTKGDWEPEMAMDGSRIIHAYADNEEADEIICRDVRHNNMYLIAAAPDMYEALKVAERWCRQRLSDGHVDLEMIHLALAKAEGK